MAARAGAAPRQSCKPSAPPTCTWTHPDQPRDLWAQTTGLGVEGRRCRTDLEAKLETLLGRAPAPVNNVRQLWRLLDLPGRAVANRHSHVDKPGLHGDAVEAAARAASGAVVGAELAAARIEQAPEADVAAEGDRVLGANQLFHAKLEVGPNRSIPLLSGELSAGVAHHRVAV